MSQNAILEDIFPFSSITPQNNFCQIKDIRITKEGYIHPSKKLLKCVELKQSPNGIHILTGNEVFQFDTLQKIQAAMQVRNQKNLTQYAANNQLKNELVVLAKEIAAYEQQKCRASQRNRSTHFQTPKATRT